MGRNDNMSMRLVNEDEFDDADLSDGSDNVDLEKVELHKLRVTKSGGGPTGPCSQVVVFLMFWLVMMGTSMLCIHVVAREDPNRSTLMLVAISAAWVALSNLFAFLTFIIDKYHAFNRQPRVSEALVQLLFMLGGVLGGWLAICLTCYRPPGVKKDRMSGFICRGMFFSAIGLALVVFLIVRVLIPNVDLLVNIRI